MKNLKSTLAAVVTLCIANVSLATAGVIEPPVAVSAPSFISLAAVAVVAGIIAYKRRK